MLGAEPKDVVGLVLEVVWTSGGRDKLSLSAALGVPEVWVWRKGALRVHRQEPDGSVTEVAASRVLPGIDLQHLLGFLDRPEATAVASTSRGDTPEPGGTSRQ